MMRQRREQHVSFLLLCFLLSISCKKQHRPFVDVKGFEENDNGNKLADESYLLIRYSCSSVKSKQIVLFELMTLENDNDNSEKFEFYLLRNSWDCAVYENDDNDDYGGGGGGGGDEGSGEQFESTAIKYRKIRVKLPPTLRYRPDLFASAYNYQDKLKLRVCMVDSLTFIRLKKAIKDSRQRAQMLFKLSLYKNEYDLQLDPPYSRPSRSNEFCLNFNGQIMNRIYRNEIYKCDYEDEVINVLSYPVLMNHRIFGVPVHLKPYKNPQLESERIDAIHRPRMSLVFWLYLNNYCEENYCSIYQRSDFEFFTSTPSIFLTDRGNILVEIIGSDTEISRARSFAKVPLNDWCRFIFTMSESKWTIIINCRKNFNSTIKFGSDYASIFYDELNVTAVIGGYGNYNSFRGYLGKFTIYRRKLVKPDDLPAIDDAHPMFKLNIKQEDKSCNDFLNSLKYFKFRISLLSERLRQKRSCLKLDRFFPQRKSSGGKQKVCSLLAKRLDEKQFDVDLYKRIRNLTLLNSDSNGIGAIDMWSSSFLGRYLYDKALNEIQKNDFSTMRTKTVKWLTQASCSGNDEASFMLSVIYSQGVGIESNPAKSSFYLMKSALNSDRMSLLALGHKHQLGLDGLENNLHISYYYYRQVAQNSFEENYAPIKGENYPNSVRLNQKEEVDSLTRETGDLFYWLKDRARQNVMSAQRKLASMLYWGSGGVQRNIEAGTELYRKGAKQKDPASLYSYGLALLKGEGVERNIEEAKKNFILAAELGEHKAYASLGHIAFSLDKDEEKAYEYWLKGWTVARDRFCAHNLGYFWAAGKVPGQPKDLSKAWDYWAFAATRGFVDSQIRVMEYNAHGFGVFEPIIELANEWARYVAERTSIMGKYMQEGALAYKEQNWPLAILFYLMGASAGLEVASFNIAFICEENPNELASKYIEKECMWSFYNQSIHLNPRNPQAYALNKMGDYYFELSRKKHLNTIIDNIHSTKAVESYALAYIHGDPQGLFNLALMIEEGYKIPYRVWRMIDLQDITHKSNYTQLVAIYEKCTNEVDESEETSETNIPCWMALIKAKFLKFYFEYGFLIKFIVIVCFTVLVAVLIPIVVIVFIRRRRRRLRLSHQRD